MFYYTCSLILLIKTGSSNWTHKHEQTCTNHKLFEWLVSKFSITSLLDHNFLYLDRNFVPSILLSIQKEEKHKDPYFACLERFQNREGVCACVERFSDREGVRVRELLANLCSPMIPDEQTAMNITPNRKGKLVS